MDGARGALVPLAAAFHLRGIEARWSPVSCRGRWVKIPAEELGRSLTLGREGLSGLPHHKKPVRNGFAEGWSIYPPCPMAAPLVSGRRVPGASRRDGLPGQQSSSG